MSTRTAVLFAVAIVFAALAAERAYAYSCRTYCYYLGNTQYCNTNCY